MKNDKYSMISWLWHRNCYKEKLFKNILREIKKEKKMIKINILWHIQNSDISADSL